MNYPDDFINKIIQGDCLEVMKHIPDNSIDLVITSPPYDELRDYDGYTFDFQGIANELYRIIKQGGIVVWVVGDSVINGSESGTSFRQALYFKDVGFNIHDTMIYMKNGSPYPEKTRYYQSFEYMFILSKGKPSIVNLISDRENKWTGSWGDARKRQKDGTLKNVGKISYNKYGIRYNVWKINTGYGFSTKDKIAYHHPAIFPEKLAGDHIISWSNEGSMVLDPMSGSGTTCKMAKLLNRNYIGIELSEKYCQIARDRIENTLPLFS